jgi:hypothetical protein
MSLSLAQATTIIDGALKKGRALNLKPIGVAVLDARGVLVAYSGEDGGGLFRPDIARAKAYGCLGMNLGGRPLAQRSADMPQFASALIEFPAASSRRCRAARWCATPRARSSARSAFPATRRITTSSAPSPASKWPA